MPERGARKPLAIALVDDPVLRALIPPPRPRLDHIPAINNIHVLESGHSEPVLLPLIPDLQAFLAGLLQQDGDAAEVGVRPDAELARFGCVARWVADHLHGHHGFLGECFQYGGGVAEAFEEDLPDRGAEAFGLFVVGPDWGSEVGFWEIGPYVWAVEAGRLQDWILVPDEVGLCSIAFSYVANILKLSLSTGFPCELITSFESGKASPTRCVSPDAS